MTFWRRKRAQTENPFRALDAAAFDRGAKINKRASELQHVAMVGLSERDGLTALGNALGNEVAAMIGRHPNMSIDKSTGFSLPGRA